MTFFFFFNDTATTEIYTLSLHDALPIFGEQVVAPVVATIYRQLAPNFITREMKLDRKSTRLNSSHGYISYAVFCLKKKKTSHNTTNELRAEPALRQQLRLAPASRPLMCS